MVDNTFMEEVVVDILKNNEETSKAYPDLPTAIVLWDNM